MLKKLILPLLLSISLSNAVNVKEGSFIRDSEIEGFLKDLTHQIFKVAGLGSKKLNLYVMFSSEVNAAATFDTTMLVNTGLIMAAENAGQVAGVLAHETGHIAGGHLIRRAEAQSKSFRSLLAGIALGAASILAGSSELGTAVLMSSMDVARNSLLHYSRGQESAADLSAVRYMQALNWPVKDFYGFMKILAQRELLSASRQFEYMRTHPFSQTRMNIIEEAAKKSGGKLPGSYEQRFQRVKQKIQAFAFPPNHTLVRFAKDDTSEIAHYAKAVAYYRLRDFDNALLHTKALLSTRGNDAFYHELHGQILFDMGNPEQSKNAYERALKFRPNDALIRLAYIETLLALGPKHLNTALDNCYRVRELEKDNPRVMHFLAIAYGRQGRMDEVALALAEKHALIGDYDQALKQTKRAVALTKDKQVKLRASDIEELANEARRQRT